MLQCHHCYLFQQIAEMMWMINETDINKNLHIDTIDALFLDCGKCDLTASSRRLGRDMTKQFYPQPLAEPRLT